MKITKLSIANYLGARSVETAISTPVTLICGKNDAGKSSISEAIRHAFAGSSTRVSDAKKKDLKTIVSDGAEIGYAYVEYNDDKQASITLPSGVHELKDHLPESLPFVLDAQRFTQLNEKEKRSFLFGLMGIKIDPASICQRMIDADCNQKKVERVKPLLRGGFAAGQEEAANKAREAKGSWKTTTGGQTWGKDKAEKWLPEPLAMGEEEAGRLLQETESKINQLDQAINAASTSLGTAKEKEEQRGANASQREELVEKAGNLTRIKAKLEKDEAELKQWEEKVAVAKGQTQSQDGVVDPVLEDLYSIAKEMLRVVDSTAGVVSEETGLVVEWEEYSDLTSRMRAHVSAAASKDEGEENENTVAPDQLAQYEKSLSILRNSVNNGKRDLVLAEEATTKLANIDSDEADDAPVDARALEEAIEKNTQERQAVRSDADKFKEMYTNAVSRERLIATARELHDDILGWLKISDALSPNGIQNDILSEALTPLNNRLKQSAGDARWGQVSIGSDMQVLSSDGKTQQPYHLLSESGQWRTEAMIAEAISYISGIKMLFLDRFDVLDMQNRSDFIFWLNSLAESGDLETCFVFGTLKAVPSGLPGTIKPYWIENGALERQSSKTKETANV